jgi:hypothetical protein
MTAVLLSYRRVTLCGVALASSNPPRSCRGTAGFAFASVPLFPVALLLGPAPAALAQESIVNHAPAPDSVEGLNTPSTCWIKPTPSSRSRRSTRSPPTAKPTSSPTSTFLRLQARGPEGAERLREHGDRNGYRGPGDRRGTARRAGDRRDGRLPRAGGSIQGVLGTAARSHCGSERSWSNRQRVPDDPELRGAPALTRAGFRRAFGPVRFLRAGFGESTIELRNKPASFLEMALWQGAGADRR